MVEPPPRNRRGLSSEPLRTAWEPSENHFETTRELLFSHREAAVEPLQSHFGVAAELQLGHWGAAIELPQFHQEATAESPRRQREAIAGSLQSCPSAATEQLQSRLFNHYGATPEAFVETPGSRRGANVQLLQSHIATVELPESRRYADTEPPSSCWEALVKLQRDCHGDVVEPPLNGRSFALSRWVASMELP